MGLVEYFAPVFKKVYKEMNKLRAVYFIKPHENSIHIPFVSKF